MNRVKSKRPKSESLKLSKLFTMPPDKKRKRPPKSKGLATQLSLPKKSKSKNEIIDETEAASSREAISLREHAIEEGMIMRTAPKIADCVTVSPESGFHDCDISKKAGNRRNRYLLALPGIFSLINRKSGRIGELVDTHTPNPVLYIEFPQGKLKLYGTFLHPKNQIISMSMPSKKKERGIIQCLDVFEEVLQFVKWEWLGDGPLPEGIIKPASLKPVKSPMKHSSPMKRHRSVSSDEETPSEAEEPPSQVRHTPRRSATVISYKEVDEMDEDSPRIKRVGSVSRGSRLRRESDESWGDDKGDDDHEHDEHSAIDLVDEHEHDDHDEHSAVADDHDEHSVVDLVADGPDETVVVKQGNSGDIMGELGFDF